MATSQGSGSARCRPRRRRRIGAALLALAAIVGPGPAGAECIAPPQPKLPTVGLEIVGAASGAHRFAAELAATAEQQECGLMLRQRLGEDEAMIFPYSPPQPIAFWMKNTILPLDLLFVTPAGRIGRIAENAVPFSEEDIPSGGPVSLVVEVLAGTAARLGLAPGDRVLVGAPADR